MAALPIVTGENAPILRAKTIPVAEVTKDVLKLLKQMEETRIAANGAGIAAPQVARSERMCIAVVDGRPMALINPMITEFSADRDVAEEGCLSLPGIWVDVPRSRSILVKYLNERGHAEERKLMGWDARVVQHEVDHLEGKLIVDYR